PGANRRPLWLPDGQRLLFLSFRDEHWGIYLKDLTRGDQPADLVLRSDRPRWPLWPYACLPDSRSLVVGTHGKSGDWTVSILPLTGDRNLQPLKLDRTTGFIDFSPDGRWITYTSGKSGVLQTYVRRFPDGEEEQVSTGYGVEGLWSANGDEMYYRDGGTWFAVTVTFEPSLRASPPRKLFSGAFYDAPGYSYAVAPDAQRFLVFVPEPPDVPLTQLEVITNWTAEVARKVAAGKAPNSLRQSP
ncbi:MAG: hypothetical protein FJ399_21770, partial [Verrucomicrobia bacterium]|nr:hypothetical protein [Verrucomicrobiota bacterium]